ncbi:hypothetical protein Q3G72_017163 [Acer saccharum]|nr:hypothetical protein Q3G72_017163 [Acer saccharum]
MASSRKPSITFLFCGLESWRKQGREVIKSPEIRPTDGISHSSEIEVTVGHLVSGDPHLGSEKTDHLTITKDPSIIFDTPMQPLADKELALGIPSTLTFGPPCLHEMDKPVSLGLRPDGDSTSGPVQPLPLAADISNCFLEPLEPIACDQSKPKTLYSNTHISVVWKRVTKKGAVSTVSSDLGIKLGKRG